MRKRLLGILLAAASTVAAGQGKDDASSMVDRVGRYVEDYYGRAQSVVAEETVILQPLARDLTAAGFARRLLFELRLDWDPSRGPGEPTATIVRQLLRANGPPLGPPDQPDCLDPRTVTPEPLLFLLPDRREKFRFQHEGTARVDGREAVRLDYVPRAAEPPVVTWKDQCGQVDLPGRMRGRIWVDPVTAEILRFDERLVGPVDIPGPDDRKRPAGPRWFTFERADTSIHYRRVAFTNPDEIVMLPSRMEGVVVIQNSGVPRLRITQSFSNYRRFVTESRIVR